MSLDDTHPDVRRAQFARLRQMTETERLGMVEQLTKMTVHLSRHAIRETMPSASEQQVILRWIELTYGKELAQRVAPFAERLGRATAP
ncbi:MAG: hypothetical protein ABIP94_08250 [Planctomycetota bacterium]